MALALGQSSRWPLVLASNRDEFHDRPTLPLSRWITPGGAEVISGRDLQAGGTWLGCTPGGRVALLTNVRERAPTAGSRSRGELALRWLEGIQDSAAILASTPASDYAGCNLLMGDSLTGEWTWASNRGELGEARSANDSIDESLNGWHFKDLKPGLYGLSNALLDTPWPKTLALKDALADALAQAQHRENAALAELQSKLWCALTNRERAAPELLPSTGVDAGLEHGLSSAWVDLPERGYGTRCSSLVWTEAMSPGHLRMHISEKTWTRGGLLSAAAALHWPLPHA